MVIFVLCESWKQIKLNRNWIVIKGQDITSPVCVFVFVFVLFLFLFFLFYDPDCQDRVFNDYKRLYRLKQTVK